MPTWPYNATRGSSLLMILFHGVVNWLSVSDSGGPFAPTIMTMPVMMVGAAHSRPVLKEIG